MTRLRIATRRSRLALAQTERARQALEAAAAAAGVDAKFEIVPMATTGDLAPDRPFEAIGPKGVFVREIQAALLDGGADLAVHSLKDLEAVEPEGLEIAAVFEREDVRDVIVSRSGASLAELPAGARVGTSSARRRAELRGARPDLVCAPLRGNVDTRLEKIRRGDVDAGVLAGAGLVRLGHEAEVAEWLDPRVFVPAPGQGALAIEMRADRDDLAWVRSADDPVARACVEAERAFLAAVGGGCDVPLGAWARPEEGELLMDVFVASAEGTVRLHATGRGHDPQELARALATRLEVPKGG